MNRYVAFFLLAVLPLGTAFATSGPDGLPNGAAAVLVEAAEPGAETLPCPTSGGATEVAGNDCCRGHKGVCGCRAGRIVCCDGTASPDCTCLKDEDSGVVH